MASQISSQSPSSTYSTPEAAPFTTSHPGVTGTAFQNNTSSATSNGSSAIPLHQLEPKPQLIDCPKCHQQAQTKVQGRSSGAAKFHNVFWWPLPNREHFFEKTHWFCENCNHELATQRYGKDIDVLV